MGILVTYPFLLLLLPLAIRGQSTATDSTPPKRVETSLKKKRKPKVGKTLFLPVYSQEEQHRALELVSLRSDSNSGEWINPEALLPFFRRLEAARAADSPVHVLQYGDSHTASDDWADEMRNEFQRLWGNGGPGFTSAGHPYRGYRRFDVTGTNSLGWKTEGTLANLGDGRDGLAGVSIETKRPGETVSITTSGDCLQLLFLRQPMGGSFTISSESGQIAKVSTEGALGTGTYDVPVTPGVHSYTVTTRSYAPVRLFGWISENRQGITWETLGINGAQTHIMLHWDQPVWAEQVKARDPALVIIAYGTNEAFYPFFDETTYSNELLSVVQRVQETVPDASILLVGPPDCDRRRPFPHLQEIIETQMAVARRTNVAFWNWAALMDESGGRSLWLKAGLSQTDLTHLTGNGYRLLGHVLAQKLLTEYQDFEQSNQSNK